MTFKCKWGGVISNQPWNRPKDETIREWYNISEWYSIPFKPFYKIRPDKEFYKELNGGTYHTIYEADKIEQLAPQLWRYDWYEAHSNYYKGLNRNYNFKGIRLDKF